MIERAKAIAEQRVPRNPYRDVELQGCQQSLLPTYRLPQAFGRIVVPDEHGLWEANGASLSGAALLG